MSLLCRLEVGMADTVLLLPDLRQWGWGGSISSPVALFLLVPGSCGPRKDALGSARPHLADSSLFQSLAGGGEGWLRLPSDICNQL